MKTSLVILASVLLVLGMVGVAFAVGTASTIATVTVNERIDITLTGDIGFGSVSAGSTDNPDANQGVGVPAVIVKNEATSTVNINLQTKGEDWDASLSLANSNVRYNDAATRDGSEVVLTTSYVTAATNMAPGSSANLWYWMDIPSTGVTSGLHDSTFSFNGIKTP